MQLRTSGMKSHWLRAVHLVWIHWTQYSTPKSCSNTSNLRQRKHDTRNEQKKMNHSLIESNSNRRKPSKWTRIKFCLVIIYNKIEITGIIKLKTTEEENWIINNYKELRLLKQQHDGNNTQQCTVTRHADYWNNNRSNELDWIGLDGRWMWKTKQYGIERNRTEPHRNGREGEPSAKAHAVNVVYLFVHWFDEDFCLWPQSAHWAIVRMSEYCVGIAGISIGGISLGSFEKRNMTNFIKTHCYLIVMIINSHFLGNFFSILLIA